MDQIINFRTSAPKYSRSRNYTRSTLSPHVAAAMLSFRWTTEENTNRAGSELDDSDNGNNNRRRGSSKASRKQKKSTGNSKRNLNNNDEYDEELQEYEPVSIPEFHDVQTAWPGFDHEPVPNWEEKYMIAKPYPRAEKDISSKSAYITYGNDNNDLASVIKRNSKSARSKSRTTAGAKQNKAKQTTTSTTNKANNKSSNIPIQRTGSCIK